MCLVVSKVRKKGEIKTKKILKYGTTYKRNVIRVKKRHCDVSSRMYNIKFTYLLLSINWLFFLKLNVCRRELRIIVISSSHWNLSVVSIYRVILGSSYRPMKHLIFGIWNFTFPVKFSNNLSTFHLLCHWQFKKRSLPKMAQTVHFWFIDLRTIKGISFLIWWNFS